MRGNVYSHLDSCKLVNDVLRPLILATFKMICARPKVRQNYIQLQLKQLKNPVFLKFSLEILIGYWTMNWPNKQNGSCYFIIEKWNGDSENK